MRTERRTSGVLSRGSTSPSCTVPSKSGKQHRLMELVAHDPAAAKRLGIPQSVGEEYAKADEGKQFPKKKRAKARLRAK